MSHYRMLHSFLKVSMKLILFFSQRGGLISWTILNCFRFWIFFFWKKFLTLGKSKRKAKYPICLPLQLAVFFKKL